MNIRFCQKALISAMSSSLVMNNSSIATINAEEKQNIGRDDAHTVLNSKSFMPFANSLLQLEAEVEIIDSS